MEVYLNLGLEDLVINGEVEQWIRLNEVEGLEMFREWYYISSFGRIKSVGGRSGDRILKQSDNGKGYLRVYLRTLDSKPKIMSIHRLVALVFVSGYEDGLVCNHLDEDSKNNHFDNLEWCTQKQNVNHGTAIERRVEQLSIPVIGTCVETGEVLYFESAKEAGFCGFSSGNVSSACRGKYNHHCKHGGTNVYRGFKWSHAESA